MTKTAQKSISLKLKELDDSSVAWAVKEKGELKMRR
jgi:hypothetical protein